MSPADANVAPLWPLILYIAAVFVVVGVMLGASFVLGGRTRNYRAKQEPYESGILPSGGSQLRLSAKFYLVAMFFVVFDLEAVFIFAWAVVAREAGWPGYVEMMIFMGVLLAGLVYLWRLGALDWAPRSRGRLMQEQGRTE